MQKICEESQKYSSRIFLYGTKQNVIENAANELKLKYPRINIVDICNGYEAEENVIKKIKKSNPDIIFVGLGSPKQEEFIIKNMNLFTKTKILMPVGGTFDVISKSKKRAPNWMIKCNIEWLFRLFQEPKRIFRQIKLFKFIYLILKNKEKG